MGEMSYQTLFDAYKEQITYLTEAGAHGGGDNFVGCETMYEQAEHGDVRHGVERADLVEMYLRDGHAVGMTLRFGNQAVDRHNVALYLFRQVKVGAHDVLYVVHRAVVVMG